MNGQMTKKKQEKSISEENIQEQKPRRWSKAKWRHQESKYWSEYAYNKFQEGRRWEFSSFDQLQRKCNLHNGTNKKQAIINHVNDDQEAK